MKNLYVLMLSAALVMMAACGKKAEEPKEETTTVSTVSEPEAETETEDSEAEGDESADLTAFAGSIASGFTDAYGFDATGEYSEADGIVITITAEGSSEWMDHAWDEMKDSIDESYNESISTMNRAGTGNTSLTYLVCDTDGVSYLRYSNGEVEDLADDSRQSIQD